MSAAECRVDLYVGAMRSFTHRQFLPVGAIPSPDRVAGDFLGQPTRE